MTRERVNFRPLKLITTLRVGIVALLTAFAIVLFLSFGKKEDRPVQIHLSEPRAPEGEQVVDFSENFAITGTKGDQDSFRLQAQRVTGFVGEKKLLEGVHLEVFDDDGERLVLTGLKGQFDLAEKRAQLSGDVLVRGKKGFELRTESLYYDSERDMIFTPQQVSFENDGLEGQGRGLNYLIQTGVLKIPADVQVRTRPVHGEDTPVVVESGDLTLGLEENEIIFTDSVLFKRNQEQIASNYLKVIMDEHRKEVVSVMAYGRVRATFVTGDEKVPAHLEADSLLATMAPGGEHLEKLDAFGNCRLSSQGVTATSETLEAETARDRIALRGNPVVIDSRSRIAAEEIDFHPAVRGLEARGEVKTSIRTGTTDGTTPGVGFFSQKEAVYFQSARLVVEDGGQLARYSGGVRGWQGDDSIQAMEILLHHGDRRMKAFRDVLCRFAPSPSPDATTDDSQRAATVVVADTMDFIEAEGAVHYRGGVRLNREEATMNAERMDLYFLNDSAGGREIEKISAEGNVRFHHLNHSGSSDRLTYMPDRELAEMQQDAGLAEVVDRTNGRTLRGKTLTFDLARNRVLTETVEGGRTWITLDPKERNKQDLEPRIGH